MIKYYINDYKVFESYISCKNDYFRLMKNITIIINVDTVFIHFSIIIYNDIYTSLFIMKLISIIIIGHDKYIIIICKHRKNNSIFAHK
jgi:ABC-type oligopeptide transport system ATPase subunit